LKKLKRILLSFICFLLLSLIPTASYAYSSTTSYGKTSGVTTTRENTAYTKNGWQKVSGKWHFYQSGIKTIGWLSDNGKWYYLDTNGVMKTGWLFLNSKWYYLDSAGAMKTGWLYDRTWYYLNPSGDMAKGWIKDHGVRYYLGKSGAMKTGWIKEGANWYLLGPSGAMQTGWSKQDGVWYYLAGNGVMLTGWLRNLGPDWYYLNESGAMQVGLTDIEGMTYYFKSNGAMASDVEIDGNFFGGYGPMVKDFTFINTVQKIAKTYELSIDIMTQDNVQLKDQEGYIGFVHKKGVVYVNRKHQSFAVEIAKVMGVPASESELIDLINQADASNDRRAWTDPLFVTTPEGLLGIFWGEMRNRY
jgi:glucan-binding YG repeat protein